MGLDDELVAVAQAHARDAHVVDLTAEVILSLAGVSSPLLQPVNQRKEGTE